MASGGAVREVRSPAELEAAVAGVRAAAVHFWASWCEASKQMDEVFAHLAVDFPHAAFLRVRASAATFSPRAFPTAVDSVLFGAVRSSVSLRCLVDWICSKSLGFLRLLAGLLCSTVKLFSLFVRQRCAFVQECKMRARYSELINSIVLSVNKIILERTSVPELSVYNI